jgi:hypothetical protein
MSDLIERLREEPYPYEKRHGLGITAMEVWHKTACEAADELEAKDAEIERLRAAILDFFVCDKRETRTALRDLVGGFAGVKAHKILLTCQLFQHSQLRR